MRFEAGGRGRARDAKMGGVGGLRNTDILVHQISAFSLSLRLFNGVTVLKAHFDFGILFVELKSK